jgi:hypothetical protein
MTKRRSDLFSPSTHPESNLFGLVGQGNDPGFAGFGIHYSTYPFLLKNGEVFLRA